MFELRTSKSEVRDHFELATFRTIKVSSDFTFEFVLRSFRLDLD